MTLKPFAYYAGVCVAVHTNCETLLITSMPISYVDDISDGSGAFIFVKILRRTFEDVVRFCEGMKGNIPVSFLLGFFVSGVIGRWYQMYMYIPWMNHIAYATMSYVNCADKAVSREIRISLMRYLNLAWILLMRRISDQIADRFKQLEDEPAWEGTDGFCPSKICRLRQLSNRSRVKRHPWSISQFQNNQHSVNRTPRTPFDGGLTSAYRQTMMADESPGLALHDVGEMDMFLAFEGEDEWSIRKTLQEFNKDPSKHFRFPLTSQQLIAIQIRETFGKIITESEIKAFEAIAQYYFKQTRQRYLPEYWVPLQWAVRLVQKAGLHGNLPDPRMIGYMFKEIGDFRHQLQTLEVYSSIMMPLVYTQVVIIAVYSYFGCEILASQFLEMPKVKGEAVVDFFIPVFSIFYFLFLMGWLKVALCVMNPFGDDDEDFETSDILDYNLDVSYRSVLMEEATFPETLHEATFETKPMKGVENDNLNDFIQSVIRERDSIDGTSMTNEWKGSLYKLVWLDLVVYLCVHYFIQAIYWFALNPEQKT
ncbi:unnamed protein product [Mesocestoides corti]|uniref:Bestrophin homolog n=1 Tax=Mesocestoides corti TaxID=53468 RepID=A0A0R3UB72_MESCO|nr:unnamed protein product [Mesocestoides corti]